MIQKEYATVAGNDAAHRYSPGAITGIETRIITGNPYPQKISTSFVERQNLTLRMGIRRMTRLINAYSKKLRNHKGAISLHVGHYNFCRVHETLRITPAMAIGVTDHVWTIGELISTALNTPEAPAPEAPTTPPTMPHDPRTGLLVGRPAVQAPGDSRREAIAQALSCITVLPANKRLRRCDYIVQADCHHRGEAAMRLLGELNAPRHQ
jgi:hypothetical protein